MRTYTRSLRDHAAVQRCPTRPDSQDVFLIRDLKQDIAPRCWPSLSRTSLAPPLGVGRKQDFSYRGQEACGQEASHLRFTLAVPPFLLPVLTGRKQVRKQIRQGK